MKNFNFILDECPKGLINLQFSSDENVIFTYFVGHTDISDILQWVTRLGCKFGDDAEMHLNFEKECIDIVLPLQIFKI